MRRMVLVMALMLVAIVTPADGKVKLPDTYNYNRGVEEFGNGNWEEALNYFNNELEDNPRNGYAYLWIALIHNYAEERGRTLSAVESALKYLPPKNKAYIAHAYAIRAGVYLELKDTTKALSDYSMAVKIDPQTEERYEHRAQLYYELGMYELADADYKQIQKLDKTSAMGYLGIGRNRVAQQRWDEAIELCSYVISLNSDNASAYSLRAEAYMGKERWNEAADDIIMALSLSADDNAFALMQPVFMPD